MTIQLSQYETSSKNINADKAQEQLNKQFGK